MASTTSNQKARTRAPQSIQDQFAWFNGRQRYSEKHQRPFSDSIGVRSDPEARRVWLYLKGYDKKQGGPGMIAVELTQESLQQLQAHLGVLDAEGGTTVLNGKGGASMDSEE